MRLVDADIGDKELRRLYDVWNLAMAPAEGREIAAIDKNMRMLKLMRSFLKSMPTVDTPENKPQTNFEAITANPESLAKFLRKNYAKDISALYCHGHCSDDDDCPHELQCVIDWLNAPVKEAKNERI